MPDCHSGDPLTRIGLYRARRARVSTASLPPAKLAGQQSFQQDEIMNTANQRRRRASSESSKVSSSRSGSGRCSGEGHLPRPD
jgi:hypothetical protein